MKKLSILLLAVVALLFVGMYNAPTAQANLGQNTDLNVTVVEGKGLVNRTNQKLNVPHGFGSKVSVDISGLVNSEKGFAYYILNGEKIDTEIVNLTLSGSTNLVIVMAGAGEKAVSYVDTNGELLDVDYVTEGEPVFTGVNPVKPGFNFTGFSGSYEDNHAVYTAQYSRVNQTLINVSVTGGTKDLAEVKYNDVVTLTPDAGNFSYWADMDGQVISRNPNYAFSALNDVQIQAVFNGAVNTDPVIYLSNVTGITPNAKSFLGYIEGDFVEYGVLASNKEEVLTLDTLDVTVIPSQALNPETNEFLRSIPETEDLKSFRAYAKLADGSVVYSENNFLVVLGTNEIVNASYTGTTMNMGSGNNASLIGLNPILFDVTSTQRVISPIHIGLNKDGEIRLYSSTDNNGNILSISIDNAYVIDQVKIIFGGTTSSAQIIMGEEEVFKGAIASRSTHSFDNLDITSFSIKNIGSGNIYIESIEISYKTPTLYVNLYEVKFINNDNLLHKQYVQSGKSLTDYQPIEVEGYSFVGWYNNDVLFNISTPIRGNLTLTAMYEINEYTLTFDTDGGTPVSDITADYATNIVAPAAPTKEGYTFTGWSPVLPETMPAGNQTYTATWTANDYTITFDVDGGSSIESLTQAYGSELVLPVPTKDGFNFVGWFTDVDKTIPFEATTMPLGNTTLYALWQDASLTSIVIFEVNGGSEIAPVVVNNGEAVVKPVDPTRDEYTFIGWYSDDSLEVVYDFDTLISTDLTLYAKWELNVYSISFDPNGGSGDIQVKSAVHGYALVESERPTQPTRDGYSFVGWFDTNATSGGNEWVVGTLLTSVKTYYARWTSNSSFATMTFGSSKYTNSGTSQNGAKTMVITGGGTLPTTVTSSTAYWDGNSNSSLRLGSGSGIGTITLTFNSEIQITSVTVYASQYDGNVSIKVNNLSALAVTNLTGTAYLPYSFNFEIPISTLTISSVNSGKTRLQIQSIVIEYSK